MSGETKERRSLILEAAERLLKHYGFAKTTVQDIAREAQCGVGTLYLVFPSKDDIFAELSARHHQGALERIALAAQGPGSYGERLCKMLEVRVQYFVEVAAGGQHSGDVVDCACDAVHAVRRQFRARELELLTNHLSQGAQAGELAVDDAAQLARVLVKIHDLYTPQRDTRRFDAIQVELRQLHRVLCHGIVRKPT